MLAVIAVSGETRGSSIQRLFKSVLPLEYGVTNSFSDALEKHQITLSDEQSQQALHYCQLLWEWNERLNLTRHLDHETFVARDVLDSVKLAEHLVDGERTLDFGAGGGVPGILLAILRPQVPIVLCDSIEKKAVALRDMVKQLGLPNEVVSARVQDHLADCRYDTLLARAVGPTVKILRWIDPHWASIGRLLLIKGPRWVEERKEARHRGLMEEIELRKLSSYPMPGTESESVILSFTHK